VGALNAALASTISTSSDHASDETGRLVRIGRTVRSGILQVPKSGRMRVILNVWGGRRGLLAALEGLVQRNVRAFRTNPAYLDRWGNVPYKADSKVWRDVPTAIADSAASNGTLAAATAAFRRVNGQPGVLGFDLSGLPTVDGAPVPGPQYVYEPEDGRTDERMVVTIDDDQALPVREINTAIARHNAWEIEKYDLPPLYSGRVRYQVEGSPELWWSAKEIHDRTYDDCEGLAAYRAGELILKGYPKASVYTRLIRKPDQGMGGSGKGGRLFHAITRVETPDGVFFDDPSVRLGMPVPRWYLEWAAEVRREWGSLG